jgi:hypothetical protein
VRVPGRSCAGVKWTLLALRREKSDGVAIESTYTLPVNHSLGPALVSMESLVMCMSVLPIVSLTRYELKRRGSRFWTDDAADDALGVSVVLRAVGGIDLVVHAVRLDEEHVLGRRRRPECGLLDAPARPRNQEDARPLTERTWMSPP